ncbi:hypothetical protein FHG87_017776, partial [Trinorchestia longiramus]
GSRKAPPSPRTCAHTPVTAPTDVGCAKRHSVTHLPSPNTSEFIQGKSRTNVSSVFCASQGGVQLTVLVSPPSMCHRYCRRQSGSWGFPSRMGDWPRSFPELPRRVPGIVHGPTFLVLKLLSCWVVDRLLSSVNC